MPLPAARQRPAYFSALPPCEVADLERAGPDSPAAVLYGQTIYLPGRRELATAVGREAFVRCCTRFPRLPRSYVLMAPGSPLASHAQWGGFQHRTSGITIGAVTVDEWICDYGPGGWAAWAQRVIQPA
jgi:hypothetical protein